MSRVNEVAHMAYTSIEQHFDQLLSSHELSHGDLLSLPGLSPRARLVVQGLAPAFSASVLRGMRDAVMRNTPRMAREILERQFKDTLNSNDELTMRLFGQLRLPSAQIEALLEQVGQTPETPRPATSADVSSPATIEEILRSRYESSTEIATTKMSTVFRCTKGNEVVAFKTIDPAMVDEKIRLRLRREMRLLSGREHPNIVKVHDYNADAEPYWYEMEFAELGDLRGQLPSLKGNTERIQTLFLRICAGLRHLHSSPAPITHRDLKPANILIFANDQPKIADAGLARPVERDSTPLTSMSSEAWGTNDYMAPEQMIDFGNADARADIYSLGVILFHMFLGHPKTHWVGELTGVVPEPYPRVIRRMLQLDPAARYQSVDTLLADLGRALDDRSLLELATGRSFLATVAVNGLGMLEANFGLTGGTLEEAGGAEYRITFADASAGAYLQIFTEHDDHEIPSLAEIAERAASKIHEQGSHRAFVVFVAPETSAVLSHDHSVFRETKAIRSGQFTIVFASYDGIGDVLQTNASSFWIEATELGDTHRADQNAEPLNILRVYAERIIDVTGGKLRGEVEEGELRDFGRKRHIALYVVDAASGSHKFLFAEHHVHAEYPVLINVHPLGEESTVDSADELAARLDRLLEDEKVRAYLKAEGA